VGGGGLDFTRRVSQSTFATFIGHICGCGHSVRYCGTSHLFSRPDRKAIRTMSGV